MHPALFRFLFLFFPCNIWAFPLFRPLSDSTAYPYFIRLQCAWQTSETYIRCSAQAARTVLCSCTVLSLTASALNVTSSYQNCAVLCCAAEYAVLLAKYFIALHIQLTTLLMSTDDSTHSSENSEHNKTALPCQQQFDFSALSVRGLRCAARDVKQADKRLVSLLGFLFSTFFYFKLLIKNNNWAIRFMSFYPFIQ